VINSNLGRIYHRFLDMASFPLENPRFSYLPVHVTLGVDGWNGHGSWRSSATCWLRLLLCYSASHLTAGSIYRASSTL